MDLADYENLRHLIRNSEKLISSENTNNNELIYTFSSLDLNEFENYLKSLPTRRASFMMNFSSSNSSNRYFIADEIL